MIRQADSTTKSLVYDMWRMCFDDSDDFVNLYFSEKYKDENTLIYFEDEKAVASLQMLPYKFTFCQEEIMTSYVSGACTLPQYRNYGYMGKLLLSSFELMEKRNIPLSILIPAEGWLYGYYTKYGYQTVFEKSNKEIPLKKIIKDSNISDAYKDFDRFFRDKDFCVQKTERDFVAIVKDAELDNFPPKYNLSGMARIIDTYKLLILFAKKYPEKSFTFQLQDAILLSNNGVYKIEKGLCFKTEDVSQSLFSLDSNTLCQLLFGFHLEQVPSHISKHFESHEPIMNLMLE